MIKQLLGSSILSIFAKLIDIAAFILLISLISKETMGLYSQILALSAFYYAAINLGFAQSYFRGASRKEFFLRDAFAGLLVRWRVLLAMASPVLLLYFYGGSYESVILIAAFQLVKFVNEVLSYYLKSRKKILEVNALLFLEGLSKLVIFVALSFVSVYPELNVVLLSIIVSSLVPFVGLWVLAGRENKSELADVDGKVSAHKPNFFYNLSFFGTSILTLVQTRVDWLIVEHFIDLSALADYALANRLYEYTMFALTVVMVNMLPWLYQKQEGEKQQALDIKLAFLFIAPMAVFIVSFLFPIVDSHVWQSKYSNASIYVVCMLMLSMLTQVNSMMYQVCLAAGKEKVVLKIAFTASLLQFAFVWFTVPVIGIWGGVIGMWLLNSFNVIFHGLLIRKVDNKSYQAMLPSLSALFPAILVLVLSFSYDFYFFYIHLVVSLVGLLVFLSMFIRAAKGFR